MNVRIVAAAVAGAIVLSVLEFLTYAMLLPEFFNANRIQYAGLMKDPPNVATGVLFNLVWTSLLAFIFDRWAGIRTFSNGAVAGALILGTVVLGINLGYVTFFNLLKNVVVVVVGQIDSHGNQRGDRRGNGRGDSRQNAHARRGISNLWASGEASETVATILHTS